LSLLSIASHHYSHNSHNSLSIHNSEVISRNTPAPLEQRIVAFAHGTRITIRDLFGNMPVRVKHRALEAERSSSTKEWDNLVRDVVALLLAWPEDVMVVLRDSASSQALTLRSLEPASDLERQSKRRLVLRTTRLLSQASLCAVVDRESWVPVKASAPGFSIHGVVCLIPAPTKRVQFISIGVEPVLDKYHSNVLYDEVNQVFSNSTFGVVEEYGSPGGIVTQRALRLRKGVDRWPMFYVNIRLEDTAGQASLVDEMLDERRASLSVLVDVLRAMFDEFLKKHHFQPRILALSLNPEQPQQTDTSSMSKEDLRQEHADSGRDGARGPQAPSKKRRAGVPGDMARTSAHARATTESRSTSGSRSRSGSPFASWAITKTGRSRRAACKPEAGTIDAHVSGQAAEPIDTDGNLSGSEKTQGQDKWRPLVGDSGRLLRMPFDDFVVPIHEGRRETEEIHTTAHSKLDIPNERATITWHDPISKLRSVIDSRTNSIVGPDQTGQQSSETRRPLTSGALEDDSAATKGVPGQWLSDFLSSWQNPVFETVEKPIPCLPATRDSSGTSLRAGRLSSHCQPSKYSSEFDKWAQSMQGRISKGALHNAEPISQVDQKFLLVKVPVDSLAGAEQAQAHQELLILVDQHAADERCRVEALMQGYFTKSTKADGGRSWMACTESLNKPLQFDLPSHEHRLLEQYKKHFEHWGVFYRLASSGPSRKPSEATVKILSLPPSIAERCQQEPRLVIDLLRTEIWRLHESGLLTPTHSTAGANIDADDPGHTWIGRFHDCPPGILDLINSRACRGRCCHSQKDAGRIS